MESLAAFPSSFINAFGQTDSLHHYMLTPEDHVTGTGPREKVKRLLIGKPLPDVQMRW
jgi:hypothetical protein